MHVYGQLRTDVIPTNQNAATVNIFKSGVIIIAFLNDAYTSDVKPP